MFFKSSELYRVETFQSYRIGSTFSSIGVPTSPIIFQIPAVEVPDPAVDADWVQMTSGAISWQLDADNLSLTVDGAQHLVRIVRASTADNCNWKW
jgi:hypothetical protein